MKPGALDGLRIVECGGGIGVSCAGKLLADLGAAVLKIEAPGLGDETRGAGPFAGDHVDRERSGLFHWLNAGKRSVVFDPAAPSGREAAARLLADADALIVGADPAAIAALGFAPATLRALHPGLVATTITPYGYDNAWSDRPGHDLTICALGGVTAVVGEPGRAPLTPPLGLSHYQAGLAAAAATLLALFAREQGSGGQHVDISALDVWATVHQGGAFSNQASFGRSRRRGGRRRPEAYPFQLLAASDGLMCLVARDGSQWKRFVQQVGVRELLDNERYRDRVAMGLQYPDEVDALLAPWFRDRTRGQIFALCREQHVPFAPVRRIDEVLGCPQLAARGFFRALPERDDGACFVVPGSPCAFSETPAGPRGPAPRLGEHTVQVLGARAGGIWPERPAAAEAPMPLPSAVGTQASATPAAAPRAPLAGVRVLDLSWVLAGPVAARLMADAGAEVIKVESRKRLDNTRRAKAAPAAADAPADSDAIDRVPMFHSLNAGKKSVAIDLSTPQGVALVAQLAAQCDVLIDNFAPGVMARLGLGHEALAALNARLVVISMSGTGQQGPLADVPAYAPTVTSLAGLDSLVGYEGEAPCGVLGLNLADSHAALCAFHAVLAALWWQRRTGRGQFIDLSEMEGLATMLGEPLIDCALNSRVMAPCGGGSPGRRGGDTAAPCGVYPVAGSDAWIAVAVADDAAWRALCGVAAGTPWAADASLASAPQRRARRAELDSAIAAWTRQQQAAELVTALVHAGVAAAPVLDVAGQLAESHFAARGLFRRVDIPHAGVHWLTGSPWRLLGTPTSPRGAGPRLGEHTHEVLGRLLSLPAAELERLQAEGVLA